MKIVQCIDIYNYVVSSSHPNIAYKMWAIDNANLSTRRFSKSSLLYILALKLS